MVNFFELVESEIKHGDDNKILTENGAIAYASTKNYLVDFAYSVNSLRNKRPEEIAALFERCYNDNPLMATKMMFQIGDVREGKGERRTFNTCLRYMALTHPEIAKALLPLVPEYTRWDHVAEMAICGEPSVQKFAREFIADQLNKDFETATLIDLDESKRLSLTKALEKTTDPKEREAIEADLKSIPHRELSLCAKWTPALGAKKPGHHKIALKIAQKMGVSNKEYRQMRSTILKHLNVIERDLSQKTLTADALENATSANQLRLAGALKKTLGNEYDEYLEKVQNGEANMNAGVITPADIVYKYKNDTDYWRNQEIKPYDPTLEELWKHLPKIQGDKNNSIIVVRDDSGSMTDSVNNDSNMTCLDVATAFAVYCAEQLEGPYKNQFISFSANPKYLDLSPFDSLCDKLTYCAQHSEIANTNIEATFDLLLKTAVNNHLTQDQIPGCVLIFSDMEFDSSTDSETNSALFENIRKKWNDAGYDMPTCAFWNLNPFRAVIPSVDDRGVVLLSGYTKDNLDLLMSGQLQKFTPAKQLELILSKPRYDAIEQAFNEGIQAERIVDANSKAQRPMWAYADFLPDEGYLKVNDSNDINQDAEIDYVDEDEYGYAWDAYLKDRASPEYDELDEEDLS